VYVCVCVYVCGTVGGSRQTFQIFLDHTPRQAPHCNTLQNTATRCNTLRHTATRSNTLQHAAIRYDALQRAATHCNIISKGDQVPLFSGDQVPKRIESLVRPYCVFRAPTSAHQHPRTMLFEPCCLTCLVCCNPSF